VRESGEPVRDAIVHATPIGSTSVTQALSREDGTFEIAGLPEGAAHVEAQARGGLHGGPEIVSLAEQGPPAEVTLVLREMVAFVGRVINPQGLPVPGAEITAFSADDLMRSGAHEVTNERGLFLLKLPAATTAARITVDAPGFALRVLQAAVRKEEVLDIPVHQDGGLLVLEFPAPDSADPQPTERELYLVHGGSLLNRGALALRAQSREGGSVEPGRIVAPDLEAGDYSWCLVAPDRWLELLSGGGPSGSCTAGFLSPGGVLHLRAGGG
jgi:hypothetical protein